MKILGRQAECLDISEVRPSDSYKVVVYQKGGDCGMRGLSNPDYCRDDCMGIHIAVEFRPSEKPIKNSSAALPPFRYISPRAPEACKGDPGKFEELFRKGALNDVEGIRNEDTMVYFRTGIFGVERPGCGTLDRGEILCIEKPRCGVENFDDLLRHLPRRVFDANTFLQDALGTYREIIAKRHYFERTAGEMSDEELLREAALIAKTPWGRDLLLERFGPVFARKAEDYRTKGINARVN